VDDRKVQQLYNLKKLVRHVYNTIPFYTRKFDELGVKPDDIQSMADIAKLPFTTKDDMRDTYPYGLLAVEEKEIVEIHTSSGTTVGSHGPLPLYGWGNPRRCGPECLWVRDVYRRFGCSLWFPYPGVQHHPCRLGKHQTPAYADAGFQIYHPHLYPLLFPLYGRVRQRDGNRL
jgi:hypothetical protein